MKSNTTTLENKCQETAKLLAVLTIGLSQIVLIGCLLDNQSLTSLFPIIATESGIPHVGEVGSAAAICMTLLAISLSLILLKPVSDQFNKIASILASVVLATGILNIAANLIGFEPVFMNFHPGPHSSGISFPAPMLLQSSIAFTLFSTAVLLHDRIFKGRYPFQLIALFMLLCAVVVLLGATTTVQSLCTVGKCFTPSIGFSLLSMCFASALFLSSPDKGLATIYASDTLGGVLIRRLTLLLVIPLFYLFMKIPSYIELNGEPILNLQSCNAIASSFSVLLAVFLCWSGAKSANNIEEDLKSKSEALEMMQQSRAGFLSDEVDTQVASLKFKKVCLVCTKEYPDSQLVCPDDEGQLSRVIDGSLEGTVFADRFKVIEKLGSGGMSTVYLARQLVINKDVAIKVLNTNTLMSDDGLKRFKREAEAIGKLDHPNIVGVNDFGLAADGRAYLVMDYCEGETLDAWLDRNKTLTVNEFMVLCDQLFSGLEHAHEKGVIHRDLKPGNIMVVKDKNNKLSYKLVDFGLAKLVDDTQSALTQTGECFGSPLYMCPEQCTGEKQDQRSDIYSLGCILFECLAGFPPIIGKNVADTISKQVKAKPYDFPEERNIPKSVQAVIYLTLQKDPGLRPKTVSMLRKLLEDSIKESRV